LRSSTKIIHRIAALLDELLCGGLDHAKLFESQMRAPERSVERRVALTYTPEQIAAAIKDALEGYDGITFASISLRRRKLIFRVQQVQDNIGNIQYWLEFILEILDAQRTRSAAIDRAMELTDGIAVAE
jgi:hypothetical protein